jgi:hypothetical protein
MALSPVEQVRLLIGDVPSSPFYQLFSDQELQAFLDMTNQDVFAAARLAAISASFQLAGWSTRERTGDIEVWSSLSTQYLKALDYLIKNPDTAIPSGLFPWSANTNSCNKLLSIELCDGDSCKEVCGCKVDSGCACNCAAGETF